MAEFEEQFRAEEGENKAHGFAMSVPNDIAFFVLGGRGRG